MPVRVDLYYTIGYACKIVFDQKFCGIQKKLQTEKNLGSTTFSDPIFVDLKLFQTKKMLNPKIFRQKI